MRESEFNYKKEKIKIKKHLKTIALLLIIVIIPIFLFGLSNLIPEMISNKKLTNSSKLGDLGSYMNVIIAITSTITVGLVFYGVRMQGLEFRSIINSENEKNKIDRAMKLYSEWLEIKKITSPELSQLRSIQEGITNKEKIYISKVTKMYGDKKLKSIVDIDLLIYLIMNDDSYERMENEFQKLAFHLKHLTTAEISTFPPLEKKDYLILSSFLFPNKIENEELANTILNIFLMDKNLRVFKEVKSKEV